MSSTAVLAKSALTKDLQCCKHHYLYKHNYMLNKTLEREEYFINLLLFHRKLMALVAVELKIGKFKPEYAGKMQFYLSVLNDKIKLEDENSAIGIIICKEQNRTIVDYALKDNNQPIGVAEYKITNRLPKDLKEYLPTTTEIKEKLTELDK